MAKHHQRRNTNDENKSNISMQGSTCIIQFCATRIHNRAAWQKNFDEYCFTNRSSKVHELDTGARQHDEFFTSQLQTKFTTATWIIHYLVAPVSLFGLFVTVD